MRLRPVPPVLLVAALALSACTGAEDGSEPDAAGDGGRVVQLGAPGESPTELTDEEATAAAEDAAGTVTEADVRFVQEMIPHHRQALEMTALAESNGAGRDVSLLAERIAAAQGVEIEQMEQWLADQGAEQPDEHAHHSGDHAAMMPGMLTPEQMQTLAAARGEEFDRLFLQSMIRHHEGAIAMVESVLAGEQSGQDSWVFQVASGIGGDQAVEIARMKQLLAGL